MKIVEEKIREIISEFCNEDGNIVGDSDDVSERLKNFFTERNIKFCLSKDYMCECPAFDASSFAIAWCEEEDVKLIVYRDIIC